MTTNLFNTGDVQSMVGIKLTAEFIVGILGIDPIERDKRTMFWNREQVARIAEKTSAMLSSNADSIRSGEIVPEPREKKAAPAPAPAPAVKPFDEDDDEL